MVEPMTSLLISILLALLVVVSVLYWQQLEQAEQRPEGREDDRVRPLLRGLNYLLADQPDLALQEVVKAARLRSEATEVYMFLGEMFRNKGEFGRAVRIHQNILARPNVDPELYVQAQFALAEDFHKGGLIDRAMRHYHKVLERRSDHLPALRALLDIHERSHEWRQAIELLQRIARLGGCDEQRHHAYLLAELAEEFWQQQQLQEAERVLREALEKDPGCVHAHVSLVHLCMLESDEKVEDALQSMAREAPEFLFLLLPRLDRSHEDFFLHQWRLHQHAELALSWIEQRAAQEGEKAARELHRRLAFAAHDLISALRLSALFGTEKELREHASKWRKTWKMFRCQKCGVRIAELRWQCPQCHHWGEMRLDAEAGLPS